MLRTLNLHNIVLEGDLGDWIRLVNTICWALWTLGLI